MLWNIQTLITYYYYYTSNSNPHTHIEYIRVHFRFYGKNMHYRASLERVYVRVYIIFNVLLLSLLWWLLFGQECRGACRHRIINGQWWIYIYNNKYFVYTQPNNTLEHIIYTFYHLVRIYIYSICVSVEQIHLKASIGVMMEPKIKSRTETN